MGPDEAALDARTVVPVLGGAVRPTRSSRAHRRRGNTPDDRPVDPPRPEAPSAPPSAGSALEPCGDRVVHLEAETQNDVTETRSGDPHGSPLLL